MDDNDFPWIKKGDKLFSSGDYFSEAVIHHDECMNKWDFYAQGYKIVADMIIEGLEDSPVTVNDKVVYPVCFLYRHYVELKLKEIIFYGSRLLDEPLHITGKKATHRLDNLWDNHVTPLLQKIFKDGPQEDLSVVREYLIQYIKIQGDNIFEEEANIDPTSFSFRYPTDKEGNPNLEGISRINLANLKTSISNLSGFLEACTTAISVYLDEKAELEVEYRLHYEEY